jgi:hypothetical protein
VGRAWVLCPRVVDLANSRQLFVTSLLGKVIAHEIGHLLLDAGHSRHGIMRADLTLDLHQPQRFTYREATSLRARLRAAR